MAGSDLVVQALEKAKIDYDRDNWNPARSFAANGLDSLDFMNLLMSVSDLFGVKVTDTESAELQTPNDLTALLGNRLDAN